MKERSVFVATPCFSSQLLQPHVESIDRLADALDAAKIRWGRFWLANDSHIVRARNVCAATFLQSSMTDLFFVDADIEFSVDDFRKIWNLDAPIAVGVYRMKKQGSGFAAWIDGELVTDLSVFKGPVTVDKAGTGFMRIKREVLEAIIEAGEAPWHLEGEEAFDCWRIFHSDVVTTEGPDPVFQPEDYWFCRLAAKLGFKTVMDPSVKLTHWGFYGYGDRAD